MGDYNGCPRRRSHWLKLPDTRGERLDYPHFRGIEAGHENLHRHCNRHILSLCPPAPPVPNLPSHSRSHLLPAPLAISIAAPVLPSILQLCSILWAFAHALPSAWHTVPSDLQWSPLLLLQDPAHLSPPQTDPPWTTHHSVPSPTSLGEESVWESSVCARPPAVWPPRQQRGVCSLLGTLGLCQCSRKDSRSRRWTARGPGQPCSGVLMLRQAALQTHLFPCPWSGSCRGSSPGIFLSPTSPLRSLNACERPVEVSTSLLAFAEARAAMHSRGNRRLLESRGHSGPLLSGPSAGHSLADSRAGPALSHTPHPSLLPQPRAQVGTHVFQLAVP